MAIGKRKRERQETLWIPTSEIPTPPAHPIYRHLNSILNQHGFDGFVEKLCGKFYGSNHGAPRFDSRYLFPVAVDRPILKVWTPRSLQGLFRKLSFDGARYRHPFDSQTRSQASESGQQFNVAFL